MSTSIILLAEIWDDKPSIGATKEEAIRRALEAAGVEFTSENGVYLRNAAG